jgi:hypothetical protein
MLVLAFRVPLRVVRVLNGDSPQQLFDLKRRLFLQQLPSLPFEPSIELFRLVEELHVQLSELAVLTAIVAPREQLRKLAYLLASHACELSEAAC